MKKFVFVLTILLTVSYGYPDHFVMKVNLKNSTTDTISVTEMSKMYFELDPNIINKSKMPNSAESFILLQNYPNPFNPSTIIQYDLPKAGKVEISIYDISGKIIRALVIQSSAAGFQKTEWDGKNEIGQKAASGNYFYTVKFEQTVLSKKMLLLK